MTDAAPAPKSSADAEEVLAGLSRAEANIEKQEDEVKHARLEVKLREMVLEVVAPTVERAVRMQNHCDHLSARIESQHGILTMMAKDVHRAMDKLGLVQEFKKQLDDFWGSQKDLELKLANHIREVLSNVEQCNHDCKKLTSTTERLNKQIVRAQEDSDHLRTDLFKMQTSLDMGVKKNKEYLDSETKRLELSIDQVKEMHKALSDEIWGPEEVTDFSPPSLRRFDMQTRQLEKTIKDVLTELRELRLLDAHVKRVTEIQEGHGVQLVELTDTTGEISQRVNKVNQDLKAEIKRTANLMSAYSANLLHEVRSSFSNEVKELAGLHQDVQVFLKETEASLQSLQESLHSSGRHVEASLREVRLDIESLDSKRKRDKMGLEESLTGLQQQASNSSTSLAQFSQSLEHLSSVMGIALQGQRMVIALGVQDFVDRKDTTYVGFKKGYTGLKLGPRFDFDSLTDVPYQPGKVNFQNDSFERPQLLALCEKLVHSGQEALSKGPKRAGGKENLQMCAESPSRVQARLGTSCGSRPPKDDRASTATTKAPATAESRWQNLGCCSPPWTSESQRLPSLGPLGLTARG